MIGLAASEITSARARRASNPDLRARWRYTVKTNQRPVTPVRRIVLPAIPLPFLLPIARRNRERKCGSRNRFSKRITKDKRTRIKSEDSAIARGESYVLFPPFLSIIIAPLRVLQIASRTNACETRKGMRS